MAKATKKKEMPIGGMDGQYPSEVKKTPAKKVVAPAKKVAPKKKK